MGDKTEKVDLSTRRERGKTKEPQRPGLQVQEKKKTRKRTGIRRLDEARRVLKQRRYEI